MAIGGRYPPLQSWAFWGRNHVLQEVLNNCRDHSLLPGEATEAAEEEVDLQEGEGEVPRVARQ